MVIDHSIHHQRSFLILNRITQTIKHPDEDVVQDGYDGVEILLLSANVYPYSRDRPQCLVDLLETREDLHIPPCHITILFEPLLA